MFRLLILTSSYPRTDEDETCGYIREFARSLSSEFRVTVLAPPDAAASNSSTDDFVHIRSKAMLPARFDPLRASADLTHLVGASVWVKLAIVPSLIAFVFTALRLARQADVICAHWMLPSGVIGALLARALQKPLVVVEHSGALHVLNRIRAGRRIARLIVSSSEHIVTVSRDLRAKLMDLCPEAASKSHVIPMGVPSCARSVRAKTNGSAGVKLLFIGRLTPIKGARVLLEALQDLAGADLVIAGDGEERTRLEGVADRLNVRVSFVGAVDAVEKLRLLSECDVLVVPSIVMPDSRAEGLPVVCLEGMALGKPVVASRVGGLPEIIVDGHNGLLFEPGDSRMLARQLARLAADEELRGRLGDCARRDAAGFAWTLIGSRFREIINRAASDHAARRADAAIA